MDENNMPPMGEEDQDEPMQPQDATACSVAGCPCTAYQQKQGNMCTCGHNEAKHTGKPMACSVEQCECEGYMNKGDGPCMCGHDAEQHNGK